MRLAALTHQAGIACADAGDTLVTGFAIDHRKVAPGTVFGAFRGAAFNAEDVIPAAIEAGAVAVVARPEAKVEGALHIASDNPRQTFALLAAQFFKPVPDTIVAVTGTNGKTSTVEMTRQIWRMCGERAASIGTLGVTTPDESVSTGLTTPDIVTFLSNVSGLAREGVSHIAFEASSHGLSQYRNEGVALKAAAFTNFSRDHLDYHGSMEEYFDAKMRLFEEVLQPGASAVIWNGAGSGEWTQKAIERATKRGLNVLTVGEHGEFVTLTDRQPTQLGQTLRVSHHGKDRTITLPLIGAYQVSNALTAAALALASGMETDQVWDAVSRLQPVRGRLERATITPGGAAVYVDYAHTADALDSAIAALRPHVKNRLLTVIGAGGDRDKGKREPMGEVAGRLSDVVLVTDDNPRGEDPAAIRAQVLAGAKRSNSASREVADRRKAIQEIIELSGEGDIILIAGKGHEQGQIIGSGENMRILPFDDVQIACECAIAVTKEVRGIKE